MKKQTNTPSVVSTLTPAPAPTGGFTLGLDLGDRSHYVCVLDATGQIIHEGPLLNDRVVLALLLTKYPAATVALEARTHSPWISRYLTGCGATVIVVNPRKLHAITRQNRHRATHHWTCYHASHRPVLPRANHRHIVIARSRAGDTADAMDQRCLLFRLLMPSAKDICWPAYLLGSQNQLPPLSG